MAVSAAAAARKVLSATTGGIAGYAVYKAKCDPPHLVWDLDNTILCSISPIPSDNGAAAAAPTNTNMKAETYPQDRDLYFDQIDDDFPYSPGIPNTRTFWRPGARTALKICGYLGHQHVYTTAQGTYTENILNELDADRTLFRTVVHRDVASESVKKGKDLYRITDRMDRAVIFDDRTKNFAPQGGENGVHVASYNRVGEDDTREVREVARLVGISFLALLAPDVRSVVRYFRSEEHKKHFPDEDES